MTTEGNYIVIRQAPNLPDEDMPEGLDGVWFDLSGWPVPGPFVTSLNPVGTIEEYDCHATFAVYPTGEFEFSSTGRCAEVWEMRPL
jgi:hypothetical protein